MNILKILVVGGEFSNKGAELMIYSAEKQLKENFPNAQLFLAPTLTSLEKIKSSGFNPLNFPLFHVGYKTIGAFKFSLEYPFLMKQYIKLRKWAKFEGDVTLKDIDIVFDISGYAFAKKWGMTPLINVSALIKYIVSHNGKYVFLPQAFGPFTEEQEPVMKDCINLSTLVMARDSVSLANLKKVSDGESNIKQYSDITLSLNVEKDVNHSSSEQYCCIVPNVRMLDRGGPEWQNEYLNLIKQAIDYILKNTKLNIKVVNHSETDDRQLVNQLGSEYTSDKRVATVFEENPLVLKKILGEAHFNLVSRFHAAASSLSENVPCVMTSWAHKYQELAQDFNIDEYCLQNPDLNKLYSLLDDLIDSSKNRMLRERIAEINVKNAKRNREMWSTIKKNVL